jgi:GNAT superfamily N-acetyltransferase
MPPGGPRPAIVEASYTYDDDGPVWFVNRALVPKACRGQGIGSELLKVVMAAAVEMGAKRLAVTPGGYENDTKRQFAFYERNGFKPSQGDEMMLVWEPA